jgi:hypothetical protein
VPDPSAPLCLKSAKKRFFSWFSLILEKYIALFYMETEVIFVWFVYHDATLVGLELEVADVPAPVFPLQALSVCL